MSHEFPDSPEVVSTVELSLLFLLLQDKSEFFKRYFCTSELHRVETAEATGSLNNNMIFYHVRNHIRAH